jgi:macrolide transport system ATP-binding/permease protein
MPGFLQDFRYAVRQLRKSPGFTSAAIVTLALGIGANAVVFSVLDEVILRPVNVPGGKNLYQVEWPDGTPSESYPDYVDLRERNRSFDGLIAYEISTAGLDSDGKAVPAWIYTASGNYFDVLGVQPYVGRFFHASDEHGPNSAPYIVLSYDYWKTHFTGDRGVVGRVVRVNKYDFTILGVAPQGFRGTELFYAPDFWAPIVNQQQIEGDSNLDSRTNRGRWLVGPLKKRVTPAQATADLNSVAAYLAKTYPKDDDGIKFALARPGLVGDMLGSPVRAFVAGLTLLAALILLAACANLGGLFAARAADRTREVAVRLALGSGRRRIVRQLLTEAVLVSLIGGALGVAASGALLRLLSQWHPDPILPINLEIHSGIATYALALFLAFASGLLFGIVPVRQVLRADPYQGIKTGGTPWTFSRRLAFRDFLLAGQIAVCAVLVTASLVAVRGMFRSLHSNFGFVPQNALQVNTDLAMAGYKGEQVAAMQKRMLETLESLPGVTAAAYAAQIPLNLGWSEQTVFSDTTADYRRSNAAAHPLEYYVSPGYFHAAGTSLLEGQPFTWDDKHDTPPVAVVNRQFARMLFGSDVNAIDKYFKIDNGTRVRVVGIVEQGKYQTLSEDPQPAMFLSILQFPSSWTWMIVRTKQNTPQYTATLEQALHALDPSLPLTINTWEKELGTALLPARAASIALGMLGAMGALLSITGIFGMAAYSVSKRMRELGVRVALGARRKEVLRAALGRAFQLLVVGSAVGVALGILASRLLAYIVYQATPKDPVVLAGVVLAMLLLGLAATWIPARRALSIDPMILLREE